ncbi:hypothetical protein [Paenibacillus sp. KR2-11]|uniref:hypothetical protein n=1 Tax=Paenibacillus sp. KR2-11 TaxID=3385500 RepID=UPI0038FC098F
MSKRKLLISLALFLCGIFGTYFILNEFLVLDRTSQELEIYDFIPVPADVEVAVEGTGEQNIVNDQVSTKIKIKNVQWNHTSYHLDEGSELDVNEYFVVHKNRQVSGLQFIPGRSVYSMGTSYRRLKQGEQRTIHLTLNKDTKQFWIMPEELIKK